MLHSEMYRGFMSELILDIFALIGILTLASIVIGLVISVVFQKLDGKDD